MEDDEDIRESLRDLLESEGYAVSTAANGQEALARLTAPERPCLILLDMMMPVMSGAEFLTVLREDQALAPIPVIVVSAWPKEAAKSGADIQGFVQKPVDLDRLLAFIRQYC